MGRSIIDDGTRVTNRDDKGQRENYTERVPPSRRKGVQVDCQ